MAVGSNDGGLERFDHDIGDAPAGVACVAVQHVIVSGCAAERIVSCVEILCGEKRER